MWCEPQEKQQQRPHWVLPREQSGSPAEQAFEDSGRSSEDQDMDRTDQAHSTGNTAPAVRAVPKIHAAADSRAERRSLNR